MPSLFNFVVQYLDDYSKFLFALLALQAVAFMFFYERAWKKQRELVVSFFVYVIRKVTNQLIALPLFFLLVAAFKPLALFDFSYWPKWMAFLVAFVLDDLFHYGRHRLEHRVPLFWSHHVSHHTSLELNFVANLRVSPGIYEWVPDALLILLGFSLPTVFTVKIVSGVLQTLTHSEVPWPKFLGAIFITPRMHAVHHSEDPNLHDGNFGQVFSIWDRIFGSLRQVDDSVQIVYGVRGWAASNNPLYVVTFGYIELWREVRGVRGLRAKVATCLSWRNPA